MRRLEALRIAYGDRGQEQFASNTGSIACREAAQMSAPAAVAHWLYEPTRLNGEPVAVIMTTTANFTLK